MALRRFHYDLAFEHYLRSNAIPYVAVDEAKLALNSANKQAKPPTKLKSFDFVVYSQNGANLLVDVKGRKHSGKTGKSLHNWVTRDDVKAYPSGPSFSAMDSIAPLPFYSGARRSRPMHFFTKSLSLITAGTPCWPSVSSTTPPTCASAARNGTPSASRSKRLTSIPDR